MDSEKDVAYRLKLAEGFLKEAEEDVNISRWRSCVDNAQLSLENTAKAVIARYSPIPKTHQVTEPLEVLRDSAEIDTETKERLSALKNLSEELGYEEHIRSDYGEEASFRTPWELFNEEDARRAVAAARQSFILAKEILKTDR